MSAWSENILKMTPMSILNLANALNAALQTFLDFGETLSKVPLRRRVENYYQTRRLSRSVPSPF